MLKDAGQNWLYGNGLGETAMAVGSIVAFPPMVLYWLGNAALGVAGYDGIGVSRVLPEEDKEEWNQFYDTVTAGPGRISAAVAGEEFITRARAKERLEKYMPKVEKIENETGVP